jgi:hypothetical protein
MPTKNVFIAPSLVSACVYDKIFLSYTEVRIEECCNGDPDAAIYKWAFSSSVDVEHKYRRVISTMIGLHSISIFNVQGTDEWQLKGAVTSHTRDVQHQSLGGSVPFFPEKHPRPRRLNKSSSSGVAEGQATAGTFMSCVTQRIYCVCLQVISLLIPAQKRGVSSPFLLASLYEKVAAE